MVFPFECRYFVSMVTVEIAMGLSKKMIVFFLSIPLPIRLFVQHDAKPSFHRWGCTGAGVVGNMKAIQITYYVIIASIHRM